MRAAAIVVAMFALAGCQEAPTTRDLFGTWLYTGDGVHRAYEFAAESDARPELSGEVLVYVLRRYPVGQEPVIVEVGRYDLAPSDAESTEMTTSVLWDETGTRAGHSYAMSVEDFDGDRVTLRDARLGALRYRRIGALP